jgi:hypothetical protein
MDAERGQSPMVVIPVPSPPPPSPEPKLLIPVGERRRGRHKDRGEGPNALLIVLLVVLLGLLLLGGGAFGLAAFSPNWAPFQHIAAACPRPPAPADLQAQFNGQQREIRELRRRAFRGDFFAQVELAHRYEGKHESDKNLYDPVESAVWYALALANPEGYDRTAAAPREGFFGPTFVSLYDECRHGERSLAYASLDRLMTQMSSDEQDKVRDRATYVLSTQGAAGFRALGRVHDSGYGPFGEPPDDLQALMTGSRWPNAVRLFERNAVDAYMYDYLAMQQGDEGAYVILQDLQRAAPWPGFTDIAEQRARRWVPPYEFYPPDAPVSGVPHTDESEPFEEPDRAALYRINALPFEHIADALVYLHVIVSPCLESELTPHDVQTFQAMLGMPTTGVLTPLEKVRAVQYAAISGSPKAELVLAVMYAEGVGVAPDYARAFHWFQEADKQGSPEAKFAVSTYFSEGLAGVADQEKAEAVVKDLDAALAGFGPSAHRLSALLDRVNGGHRGWYGYVRPEEDIYPGDGDRYGYGDTPPADPPPVGGPPPGDPLAEADPPHPDPPPQASGGEDYSAGAGDTRRVHRLAYHSYERSRPGYLTRTEALARAGRRLELASRVQENRFATSAPPPPPSSPDQTQAGPADEGSNH